MRADDGIRQRDSILSRITGATLPELRVPITKFGARGDGATDCCKAFAKAMR